MISSGIYLVGCIIYWNWVSGEIQSWAKTSDDLAKIDPPNYGTNSTIKIGHVNEAVELKE